MEKIHIILPAATINALLTVSDDVIIADFYKLILKYILSGKCPDLDEFCDVSVTLFEMVKPWLRVVVDNDDPDQLFV